jgi:hypothetical protein
MDCGVRKQTSRRPPASASGAARAAQAKALTAGTESAANAARRDSMGMFGIFVSCSCVLHREA